MRKNVLPTLVLVTLITACDRVPPSKPPIQIRVPDRPAPAATAPETPEPAETTGATPAAALPSLVYYRISEH